MKRAFVWSLYTTSNEFVKKYEKEVRKLIISLDLMCCHTILLIICMQTAGSSQSHHERPLYSYCGDCSREITLVHVTFFYADAPLKLHFINIGWKSSPELMYSMMRYYQFSFHEYNMYQLPCDPKVHFIPPHHGPVCSKSSLLCLIMKKRCLHKRI